MARNKWWSKHCSRNDSSNLDFIANRKHKRCFFFFFILNNFFLNNDFFLDYDIQVCIFIKRLHERALEKTHKIMKRRQNSKATNSRWRILNFQYSLFVKLLGFCEYKWSENDMKSFSLCTCVCRRKEKARRVQGHHRLF